jgi:hypothetical protein
LFLQFADEARTVDVAEHPEAFWLCDPLSHETDIREMYASRDPTLPWPDVEESQQVSQVMCGGPATGEERSGAAFDHRFARAWRMGAMRAGLNGSPGRIRTSDLTVNSRPLYRLSYRGAREQALVW